MSIEMKSRDQVIVDESISLLVDAVVNNPGRAAEIHDAFTAWCEAREEEVKSRVTFLMDRIDELERSIPELVQAQTAEIQGRLQTAQAEFQQGLQAAANTIEQLTSERDQAQKLQQLHWQLSSQLMAGTTEAAVTVLRELKHFELLSQQAGIARQLEQLKTA